MVNEWEYRRCEIKMAYYTDEIVSVNELLELGKQGWEAVGIIKEIKGTYCVLLKRLKVSQ